MILMRHFPKLRVSHEKDYCPSRIGFGGMSTGKQDNICGIYAREITLPAGAVLVGNIDELVPVLFNVKLASVAVYLKTSETSGWNFVQPGGTKTPTYVYDTYSHQIRFQWTEAGWAYAIVGQ